MISQDELGVHPKKVNDVSGWFDEAYNPKLAKYRRLLVLSGPAGAAKTATLRLLAEEHGVDVVEFRNTSTTAVANEDGKSHSDEQVVKVSLTWKVEIQVANL